MTLRKLFLQFHLVAGLVSAALLLLMGSSGAVLVFEGEIDHWLNAKLMRVPPEGARLPLNRLAEALERRSPGGKVSAIYIPDQTDIADSVTVRLPAPGRSTTFLVNPYSGAVLGSTDTANRLMRNVHQFHTNLLLGEHGKTITGCGAVLLLGLAVSGLVLWWPRKLWKPGQAGGKGRAAFEWHNIVGIFSSGFMVLFAATGLVIHWDEPAAKLVNRLAGATASEVPKLAASEALGGPPITPDQALAAAEQAAPGARVTMMMGFGGLTSPVRVSMKYPEDRTPAGRTNVYLDPRTSAILSMQTSRTAPIGTRVVKLWNREFHTGDICGWPTRVLAAVASLALPVLAVTGPVVWWGRRKRKDKVTG